ncbi:hypothetical protein OKW21_001085 [Catalinimonas alkaloidigena]|nr:hypothetical protein [Catalinimonas alkaloidigena]
MGSYPIGYNHLQRFVHIFIAFCSTAEGFANHLIELAYKKPENA